MTRKEIFVPGILSHDFLSVLNVLGEKEAVWWGERCASFADHTHNGHVFPLTEFPFQKTFSEWKQQNK